MSTITLTPVTTPRRAARPVPASRSGAARSGAARSSVRLTRRGRLVVFVLAFLVIAGVLAALAAGSAASREAGQAGAVELVTVAPGDTLWEIAGGVAAASGEDVREVMERIQQLNTLDSSVVYVGQELRVPLS